MKVPSTRLICLVSSIGVFGGQLVSRVARMFVAVIAVSVLAPPGIHAECLVWTAKSVMTEPTLEFVFSGRVLAITPTSEVGYRATFDVDRVWKGVVPGRVDIYVWSLQAEAPRFTQGQSTIVLASRLTDPRARTGVGLGESNNVVFFAPACSDTLDPKMREDLGPGKPPTKTVSR
jgi:hypothetical protein